MNQAIRKLSGLLVLPVLLAALLMLPLRANAAEYACDAVIPVSMELNGDRDETFEVTIELAEGMDETTPMPAEEACSILLADGESGGFAIHYTEPGDYFYVIRQTEGDTAYMSYDDTVYSVQVQVTNETAADGSWTLTYTVTAYDASIPEPAQENKAEELAFLNTYAPPTPAPTDEHPDIAEGIENGTWGGAPTPKPTATLPQTSDDLPLTALVVVLAVAAAAIVALVVLRRRKNGPNDQTNQSK